ncbi:hypothetical protein GCM10022627_00850 [Haloarcula argentinensis]
MAVMPTVQRAADETIPSVTKETRNHRNRLRVGTATDMDETHSFIDMDCVPKPNIS